MKTPDDLEEILSFTDAFAFLSNFHFATVRLDGVAYSTVEHAFQAAKTDDPEERRAIRECSSPAQAKRMGKRVKLRSDWESVKIGIMESLVRQKFTAHPELRAALLATGERRLVEGNTWGDVFWGAVRGRGKNHLGRILMRVREELAGQ
jgi:ribA/ribD-fused uncharacterized protein